MKLYFLVRLFFVKSLCALFLIATGQSQSGNAVMQPAPPVYKQLKNLHMTTDLVADAVPGVCIMAPSSNFSEASDIQSTIRYLTGVTVPVVYDGEATLPIRSNLILLGNRSTNRTINSLYDRMYTFLDLKYPGAGGWELRSLHNPFGNGKNVIFVGGSDVSGVKAATVRFIEELRSTNHEPGLLSVGHLMYVKLAKTYILPDSIKQAPIWEASELYGSKGFFGWNMVSKNMAAYYMTGNEHYLNEFLRLSFPDEAAIQEIEDIDGELIENKSDPLAGPYHYNAHMMIHLWDLIEESPLLTDEQRLRITNGFSRQLKHWTAEGVYGITKPAAFLGSRHRDWSAFSLYVLARYFAKDYPDQVWRQAMVSADLYFSALKKNSWMGGFNDHLWWFTTYFEPTINYLLISGIRDPDMLSNLRSGLNTQQVLYTGLRPDWGVKASAISMLNKAAYVLSDGRWLFYRNSINLDTGIFRLGQSYWPEYTFHPDPPVDVVERWNIQWMPDSMWSARKTGLPKEESFRWGSYRTALDVSGDYLLIKGYNGANRNPYHTFGLLELRIDGATLLKGYHNQLITSSNGLFEPKIAMDAALRHQSVLGEVVSAVAEVTDLAYTGWTRSLILKKKRYALIVDELDFRSNSDNLTIETTWETAGKASLLSDKRTVRIMPSEETEVSYELHSSAILDVKQSEKIAMKWNGVVKRGQKKTQFHLLGKSRKAAPLASIQLAQHVAMLRLPELAIAVTGQYKQIDGDLVLLTESDVYGRATKQVAVNGADLLTLSSPADIYWDFTDGKFSYQAQEPFELTIVCSASGVLKDENGRAYIGMEGHGGRYTYKLPAGKHTIIDVLPLAGSKSSLSAALLTLFTEAKQQQASLLMGQEPSVVDQSSVSPVFEAQLPGLPVSTIVIPAKAGELFAAAIENRIAVFSAEGKKVREYHAPGNIRVLHWWEEKKLLLAGCLDERVVAFDESGVIKWEFTSVIDPALYKTGKKNFYKADNPGIYGLHSGSFDGGKDRVFVGSASTIEILDEQGQLVKRLPVFWGNVRSFLLVDAVDGSRRLLAARWPSDKPNFAVVNSSTLEISNYGYTGVPPGHTFVNGWMAMDCTSNAYVDVNGDGDREIVSAVNGTWNRISIYSSDGKPLHNAQLGVGAPGLRSTIRMMDVNDLDADGLPEIVCALSSGMVFVLNGRAEVKWARHISATPAVLKIVKAGTEALLVLSCEDGSVYTVSPSGNVRRRGVLPDKVTAINVIRGSGKPVVVLTTETGRIVGFNIK